MFLLFTNAKIIFFQLFSSFFEDFFKKVYSHNNIMTIFHILTFHYYSSLVITPTFFCKFVNFFIGVKFY